VRRQVSEVLHQPKPRSGCQFGGSVILVLSVHDAVDSGHSPDLCDRIEWQPELLVRPADCLCVGAFGETKCLALGDIDVSAQIGASFLFAGLLESRIGLDGLTLGDASLGPTAFCAVMRVDKVLHFVSL
jgi:hypothetical protein